MKALRSVLVGLLSLAATNAALAGTPYERLRFTFDNAARLSYTADVFTDSAWVGRCARRDTGPVWEGVLFLFQTLPDPLLSKQVALSAYYSVDGDYFETMADGQLAEYLNWAHGDFDLDMQNGEAGFVYDGYPPARQSIVVRQGNGVDGKPLLVTGEWRNRYCYLWQRI